MTAFPSKDRKAFNGQALLIIRAKRGEKGTIVVTASSGKLSSARVSIHAQ